MVRPNQMLVLRITVQSTARIRQEKGTGLAIERSRPSKVAKILFIISFVSCIKGLQVQARKWRKN